jgi:hypothetical protein
MSKKLNPLTLPLWIVAICVAFPFVVAGSIWAFTMFVGAPVAAKKLMDTYPEKTIKKSSESPQVPQNSDWHPADPFHSR